MKDVVFESMEDVWNEFERLYDKSKSKKTNSKLGESLYLMASYFVDIERLVNQEIQDTILKYIYCKQSNTPPYKDLNSTPAYFIEDFLMIDEETQNISNSIQAEINSRRKRNA